jgi:hypothetical protein
MIADVVYAAGHTGSLLAAERDGAKRAGKRSGLLKRGAKG